MNIRILYKPDNMDGCFYQDAVNNLTTIYSNLGHSILMSKLCCIVLVIPGLFLF